MLLYRGALGIGIALFVRYECGSFVVCSSVLTRCVDSSRGWHNRGGSRSLLLFVSLCLINVEEEVGAFVGNTALLDREGVFTFVSVGDDRSSDGGE